MSPFFVNQMYPPPSTMACSSFRREGDGERCLYKALDNTELGASMVDGIIVSFVHLRVEVGVLLRR